MMGVIVAARMVEGQLRCAAQVAGQPRARLIPDRPERPASRRAQGVAYGWIWIAVMVPFCV